MSSRFSYLRQLSVASVFSMYSQDISISDGNMCTTVQGIYRRAPNEQQDGGISMYSTGPTVRLYKTDIDKYCIDRGTVVGVELQGPFGVELHQHTVVQPIVDNQDGTYILPLSEIKPHVN